MQLHYLLVVIVVSEINDVEVIHYPCNICYYMSSKLL